MRSKLNKFQNVWRDQVWVRVRAGPCMVRSGEAGAGRPLYGVGLGAKARALYGDSPGQNDTQTLLNTQPLPLR